MGLCSSKSSYISSSAGGERDYQERYLESKTLGQGEFGVVKLVHDVKNKDLIGSKPLAVKYLKKGYTFKDNTIYTPLKKEVLQGEVEILRRLNGECYNLKLVDVYESPSMIYMVTEYCEGGEMMPWVSNAFKDGSNGGMRSEDVSRICFQLWSAVDHCARHRVIHRDIKPENVMFTTSGRDAQLRLIDFGSGTLDGLEQTLACQSNNGEGGTTSTNDNAGEVDRHHTFAGSAFYISPEMFQRTYTSRTDVWSAGATLYVLVAGYPADRLQETFNVLQNGSKRVGRLRDLPNMPDNMPESFYEMLEGSLVYRHKQRKDAGQLMQSEFAQFHIHHQEGGEGGTISIHDIAAEASAVGAEDVHTELSNDRSKSLKRTTSVLLEGSVRRHNTYLGYQKFERSVTTILATMLSKDTSLKLLLALRAQHEKVEKSNSGATEETEALASVHSKDTVSEKKEEDKERAVETAVEVDIKKGILNDKANAKKLQVVTLNVLLEILHNIPVDNDREVKEVISMIQGMKDFSLYQNFAYHISLLRQFVSMNTRKSRGSGGSGDDDENISSVHGNNVWMSLRKKRGLDGSSTRGGSRFGLGGGGGGSAADPDVSVNSVKSTGGHGGGLRRTNTSTGRLSSMA